MRPWPSRAAFTSSALHLQTIWKPKKITYIFLLFVYMADLKPDIGVSERTWRVSQYAIEAHKAILVFALLLVDDAEAEKDFVFLIKL